MKRPIIEDIFHAICLIMLALYFTGCSSKPKKGFDLPPALSEVFRGGALKGLEVADSPNLGIPNQYDRVTHVCVSTPIYNLEGYYVRTDVRCW